MKGFILPEKLIRIIDAAALINLQGQRRGFFSRFKRATRVFEESCKFVQIPLVSSAMRALRCLPQPAGAETHHHHSRPVLSR
jgi:hypothetical protein